MATVNRLVDGCLVVRPRPFIKTRVLRGKIVRPVTFLAGIPLARYPMTPWIQIRAPNCGAIHWQTWPTQRRSATGNCRSPKPKDLFQFNVIETDASCVHEIENVRPPICFLWLSYPQCQFLTCCTGVFVLCAKKTQWLTSKQRDTSRFSGMYVRSNPTKYNHGICQVPKVLKPLYPSLLVEG